MLELNGRPVTVDELGSLALYNYGHFTSMLVRAGRVRGLGMHLDRLAHDSRLLFGTEPDTEYMRHLVRRVVIDAGERVAVRVTAFDPQLDLARPAAARQPQFLISTRSVSAGNAAPFRVATAAYERDLPTVKHVGLLGAVHHRGEAQQRGFDDVLFVDASSHISEGATWNVGFVRDGELVWPTAESLPGVTVRLLDDVARQHDIKVTARAVEVAELPEFEAAFAANAAVGVRSIVAVDDHGLAGDGPVAALLRKEYDALPGDPI